MVDDASTHREHRVEPGKERVQGVADEALGPRHPDQPAHLAERSAHLVRSVKRLDRPTQLPGRGGSDSERRCVTDQLVGEMLQPTHAGADQVVDRELCLAEQVPLPANAETRVDFILGIADPPLPGHHGLRGVGSEHPVGTDTQRPLGGGDVGALHLWCGEGEHAHGSLLGRPAVTLTVTGGVRQ